MGTWKSLCMGSGLQEEGRGAGDARAPSARERGPGLCGVLPRAGCGGAGGGVRPGRGGGQWHQAPDHGAELWAVRKGVFCVEKQGAGLGGTSCCRATWRPRCSQHQQQNRRPPTSGAPLRRPQRGGCPGSSWAGGVQGTRGCWWSAFCVQALHRGLCAPSLWGADGR